MKLETFFEKFDQFAEAPDAVAKMRELVLELAVRGKLVEQKPTELSASECILKANKPIVNVSPDHSIETPAGWVGLPLGCLIAANTGGGTPSKQNPRYWNGPVPWASVKDVQSEKYLVSTIDSITEEGLKASSSNLIPPNRLIVVTRMGLGKLAINTIPVAINQDLRAIEPTTALDLDFAYLLFKSLKMVGSGVTVKGITVAKLHAMPVALPPLAEQKRIVAKVDELMALCDRLEAQQLERETRAGKLARASLARFADAPTPENLNLLFPSSFNIPTADLRKSILTLAIQGLLVPQSEADGGAKDYLPQPTTIKTSALPELPPQWTWASVDETGRVDLGRQRAPQHHRGPNMRPYLRVQNVYEARIDVSDVKRMNFTEAEFATFALMSGDILLNEGQSFKLVGRPAIYRGEVPGACFQNTLLRYRAKPFVLPEYALVVFRAYMRNGRFQQISKQTTNIAHLSVGRFAGLEFPLPPLAEQRRIVAKVSELMALVDALEAQLAASRATAAKLLDALVAELTAGSNG